MQILEPTGETNDPIKSYPWHVWLELDDAPRVLDKETDFPRTDIKNMGIYLHQHAKALGLKVRTKKVQDRFIIFQVYEDPDNPPLLPNWTPSNEKPKCRHCKKVLDTYSVPFGEHRKPNRPNQRSCK